MTLNDIDFVGEWQDFEKQKMFDIINSNDPSTVKGRWSFSHFKGGIYFANKITWDRCIRADTFDECYLKLKEYYQ